MFSTIWHTFFFDPVYNALIFFINTVPGGDVGLAIIFLTIIVKVILLPLSLQASKTQRRMRELQPKIEDIKKKYKDNREQLARAMMDLYKEAGVKPFSSILLILLQIPILIALYLSVFNGGGVKLPEINTAILYASTLTPETTSMMFLGFVDIATRSFPLAILAGATQYIHTKLTLPPLAPRDKDAAPNFKEDFSRSMQLQMRYVMPLIIFGVAYFISAAIALYFLTSNIVSIAQEYFIKRKHGEVESGA